jgi:hypothetical protein
MLDAPEEMAITTPAVVKPRTRQGQLLAYPPIPCPTQRIGLHMPARREVAALPSFIGRSPGAMAAGG